MKIHNDKKGTMIMDIMMTLTISSTKRDVGQRVDPGGLMNLEWRPMVLEMCGAPWF